MALVQQVRLPLAQQAASTRQQAAATMLSGTTLAEAGASEAPANPHSLRATGLFLSLEVFGLTARIDSPQMAEH